MSAPQGYVKVGVVGYSDRGNYDATATYNKWNVVHYNNSLYYCKVDNTTNILPTTTANWGSMVKCYEPDGETIFVNQDGKLEGAPNALPDNHTILKDSNDVISVNEVYAQDETSLMSAMADLPTGATGYTPEPNTLDMNQLYADMGVNETGNTALYSHASGSYFLWKGDLVKATSAIAVGGTISSSNTTTANVAEVLTELNSNIDNKVKYIDTSGANVSTTVKFGSIVIATRYTSNRTYKKMIMIDTTFNIVPLVDSTDFTMTLSGTTLTIQGNFGSAYGVTVINP